MLRTNNKKVTIRVYTDFMDELQARFPDDFTVSGALYSLADEIEAAAYNLGLSYQDEFAYNCQCGNFGAIYYDDMRAYLAEVLEETPEEADRFDNEKVARTYYYLLYKGYLTACKKHGVNPYYNRY